MSDDLVKRLLEDQQQEFESPLGCHTQMTRAAQPYPCSEVCPCALRDRVITDADRIEALEAERDALAEKLERAVEALQRCGNGGLTTIEKGNCARATLAAIQEDNSDD